MADPLEQAAEALARAFDGQVVVEHPEPADGREHRRPKWSPGSCWCGEPAVAFTADSNPRCHFHANGDLLAS